MAREPYTPTVEDHVRYLGPGTPTAVERARSEGAIRTWGAQQASRAMAVADTRSGARLSGGRPNAIELRPSRTTSMLCASTLLSALAIYAKPSEVVPSVHDEARSASIAGRPMLVARRPSTRSQPMKPGVHAASASAALIASSLGSLSRADEVIAWGPADASDCPGAYADRCGAVGTPPRLDGGLLQASAGGFTSGVLLRTGQLMLWGRASDGATTVPAALPPIVNFVIGGYHAGTHVLAVDAEGKVHAWGWNGYQQAVVPADLPPAASVGAGSHHSLAVLRSGEVRCWGDNAHLQCSPPDSARGVTEATGGYLHSAARLADGSVRSWGAAWHGVTMPNAPELNDVVDIDSGDVVTLAVRAEGTVVGWGYPGSPLLTPPNGLTGVVQVAAGWGHAVALLNDGAVVQWGVSEYSIDQGIPAGLQRIAGIDIGYFHSIAWRTSCAADLNVDGEVDGADLGLLLANWGTSDPGTCDACDVVKDGQVDGVDLGVILATWGTCAP